MGVTGLKIYIEGKPKTEPKEWADIKIHAAFGSNSNQPQIESDRFTLVRDAAKSVIDNVANGDIFEGQDCILEYRQRDLKSGIFDGFIDTSEDYEEVAPSFGATERPNEVKVKFRGKNTITNFQDQIEGVTYGYMLNQGSITSKDFTTINTVIVKKSNFLEIAMAIITLYMLEQQIEQTIKDLSEETPDLIQRFSSSTTAFSSATIWAVVQSIIKIAYALALTAIVIKMTKDLIDLLIPPVVKNKGCKYRTLLSRVCEHYGYTFVSPIEELDTYHYLPSKPHSNSTNIIKDLIPQNPPTLTGIPNQTDYGYIIPEMFELCKRMFDAKVDVVGNEVHLRNKQDPFWLTLSDYVPPIKINFPNKRFNTSELKQTRLDSFVFDIADDWTIENAKGTSFEIKTEPISVKNIKNVVIKGLERTDYPVALPNSKDSLNTIETMMILIAQAGDDLSRLVGKKGNLVAKIKRNRINVLKVSKNEYSVAKCVPLIGGKLPPNHRKILSARFLNEKYHQGKSFVTGDKLGQKVLYDNVPIPFNLSDFQKTLKSGKFTQNDGRESQFKDIPYQFSKDIIEVNIEVQQIYTNKLKEIYIETE